MPLDQATLDAVASRVAADNSTTLVEAAAKVTAAASEIVSSATLDNAEEIAQNSNTDTAELATQQSAQAASAETTTGTTDGSEGSPGTEATNTGFDPAAIAQRFGVPVEQIQGMQSEEEVRRALAFRDNSIADILPRLQAQQPQRQPSAVEATPAAATATAQSLPEVDAYQASLKKLESFDPEVREAIEASHKAATALARAEAEKTYGVKLKAIEDNAVSAQQAQQRQQAEQGMALIKEVATKSGFAERIGVATKYGPQHEADARKFFAALQAVQNIDNSQSLTEDQIVRAASLAKFSPVPVSTATTGQGKPATPSAEAIAAQSKLRMGKSQPANLDGGTIPFTGKTAEEAVQHPAYIQFFNKLERKV